ncbi:MAG TPA: CdaR family protein [Thermoanaerobaculia bacterium]|nr:CdaR family protein [Thermoanaerobaculia bacterium]
MPRRPLFFRNLGLKILALVIALGAWFALSGQRRERISERSYRIPLSLINIPERTMVASPLPGGVDVRVRGPFTALRQLEPEKLEAVIDLRNAHAGEKQYRFAPEDINVPPDVEIIAIAPAEVRVALDRIGEKLLPIVPALAGEVAPGAEVVDVTAEPRIARVVGPAAALEKMEGVGTEPISLASRSATFSATTTVNPNAPGVRVREGQVVDVTIRIAPAPTRTPGPQERAAAP